MNGEFMHRPATRPAHQGGAPEMPTMSDNGGSSKKNKSGKKGFDGWRMSIFALLIAAAVLTATVVAFLGLSNRSVGSEKEEINTSLYQAVFIDSQDGQVYFGKLEVLNDRFYKLSDIYYVRVENSIQPNNQTQQQSQASISLAKLGNELHGPEDTMYIRRDKVLFWENIKEDGQVTCAIRKYQKDQGQNVTVSEKCSQNSNSSNNSSTSSQSQTSTQSSTQQSTSGN